jgi:ribose 5-phosphate isomerase A
MTTTSDDQKRRAGEAAAVLVESGMIVGLGTGSTSAWFVRALARRMTEERLDVRGVPTSTATKNLAEVLAIPLLTLNQVEIDLTVDGADEIGPGLALIKGAGAALLREKLVWEASRRCVVIADAAKRSQVLGKKYPLPIEVVAFGHESVSRRISDALSDCDIGVPPRLRIRDGEVVITDSGNVIYDVACGAILDPSMLADALKSVTGVVEHGLFLDLADEALIAGDGGVERLSP